MGETDIIHLLSGMNAASKKELLEGLVVHILGELNEDVKKGLLRSIVAGQKDNRQLTSMVEY